MRSFEAIPPFSTLTSVLKGMPERSVRTSPPLAAVWLEIGGKGAGSAGVSALRFASAAACFLNSASCFSRSSSNSLRSRASNCRSRSSSSTVGAAGTGGRIRSFTPRRIFSPGGVKGRITPASTARNTDARSHGNPCF